MQEKDQTYKNVLYEIYFKTHNPKGLYIGVVLFNSIFIFNSIKHYEINKNYYVVRNAWCIRSRYTQKLSLIFLINEWKLCLLCINYCLGHQVESEWVENCSECMSAGRVWDPLDWIHHNSYPRCSRSSDIQLGAITCNI